MYVYIYIYMYIYTVCIYIYACVCIQYIHTYKHIWLLNDGWWWLPINGLYDGIMRELSGMTPWRSWKPSFAGTPLKISQYIQQAENVGSCRTCNTKFTMVARQTMANRARTEQEPKTAESEPLWTYGTFGKFWISEGPFFHQGTEALMRFKVRSGSSEQDPGKRERSDGTSWDRLWQVCPLLWFYDVKWFRIDLYWFVDVFFSGVGCCLV